MRIKIYLLYPTEILIRRSLLNLYAKVKLNYNKKNLLDHYDRSRARNMLDNYLDAIKRSPDFAKEVGLKSVNKNTLEYRVGNEILKNLVLPFDPLVCQFFEYNNSDLYIHKDGQVYSRIGIVLKGKGDLIFYNEDKQEISRTDLQEWTIFTTKTFHSVENSKDRLSFVIGFTQSYQELYDWFATEGLLA